MKILFPIGSYYPSQQGGPCNSVRALAKGLLKTGHEVKVITTNYDISPDAGIPFDQWTEVEGIQVFYMRFPTVSSPAKIDARILFRPGRLLSILGSTSCDIVHPTMLFTVLSHRAAEYAINKNLPVIWSPRGSMLPYTFSRGTLKKKLFLSLPFVKRGLTGSHFHATSDEEAQQIAEVMRNYTGEDVTDRVHNIPNLVGDEVFTPGGEAAPYPYKYILHLGRVHPKKKIENLIEAFSKMSPLKPHPNPLQSGEGENGGELKLVIAGWTCEVPEYTKSLKLLVERLRLNDRVIFTEKRVEGHDKATLYRHAEVFVLPSESENFGMVVLESLAQGVPVIASNKTPWEILEKRDAGYWPANDPATLARALERFFSLNNDERKKMAVNSVALAQEYGNEALIGKYLKMYEEVVRK
ncbi:MAG TPA: glycosyltransferase [bacterium]|nr:glycosyltransferase [bacterium]